MPETNQIYFQTAFSAAAGAAIPSSSANRDYICDKHTHTQKKITLITFLTEAVFR